MNANELFLLFNTTDIFPKTMKFINRLNHMSLRKSENAKYILSNNYLKSLLKAP